MEQGSIPWGAAKENVDRAEISSPVVKWCYGPYSRNRKKYILPYVSLAQWIEYCASNAAVTGSSPVRHAIWKSIQRGMADGDLKSFGTVKGLGFDSSLFRQNGG